MARNTISGSKSPKTVPQPGSAHFVLGSRPAVLRSPDLPRIKPAVQGSGTSTRDYGKDPPLAGDTGMSGLS